MSCGTNQPDPPPTDAHLVERARSGDAAAFAELYRRHRDWVLALAWRFTRHEADALDITQEVFAYLWRRIPTLTLEARLTTFLYPAVRHRALEALRNRARHAPAATAPEPAAASSIPDNLAPLHAALADLSDDHREVVLMRFVHDMTLPEIAEAASIPLGTAKTRLHHALNHLRADPRARAYFEDQQISRID